MSQSDRTPSAAQGQHGALSGPEPGEAQGEAAASRSCQGSLDGTAPAPGPESASATMVSREVGNGLSESRADARRAAPGDRSRSRFVRRTSYGYPERYFDGDAQAFRYRIKRFETWLAGDQKIGCWEYEPWTGQA